MLDNLRRFFTRNYEALNKIIIFRVNLISNYKYLSSIATGIKVAPVLKSNAYGHGLTLIGKELDNKNAPFFCVDSLFEAYELSKAKIKTKILVMGYVSPKSLNTKKLPFSFAVYDFQSARVLNKYQKGAKIHIFVDTGMHREGVSLGELAEFVDYINSKTTLRIEGLMSHFGMAAKPNSSLTRKQVDNFQKAQKILKDKGVKAKFIHIANSEALLNNAHYKGKLGNTARVGKALYGICKEDKKNKLKPVMTLLTHVAQVKKLKKGERVGYDFTFTANDDLKIAILPIGYNDGIDRRLSNKGFVEVRGKLCKIIGRVSMNITIIDVTQVKDIRENTKAILFSQNPKAKNSISSSAELCDTVPYDLLVHFSPVMKRVLI